MITRTIAGTPSSHPIRYLPIIILSFKNDRYAYAARDAAMHITLPATVRISNRTLADMRVGMQE